MATPSTDGISVLPGAALRGPGRTGRTRGAHSTATPSPRPDALDRLIGRAVVDDVFRFHLLADPARALAVEHMPLRLKRALAAIRARDLGDFALRALDALAAMRTDRGPSRVDAAPPSRTRPPTPMTPAWMVVARQPRGAVRGAAPSTDGRHVS